MLHFQYRPAGYIVFFAFIIAEAAIFGNLSGVAGSRVPWLHGSGMGVWANIRRDQRRLFAQIPFKQLILRSWTTIRSLLGKQEPRFCYNGCPSDPLDADMGNHYYGRAAMFARTPVCTHPSLPQRPHRPHCLKPCPLKLLYPAKKQTMPGQTRTTVCFDIVIGLTERSSVLQASVSFHNRLKASRTGLRLQSGCRR